MDSNDPIHKLIVTARVKLLFEKAFFGTLATRLILVDATKWCKTAATDGKHLYYNREFIKNLKQPQLLFLLGHEVLHCVYDHLGRRAGREPKLWNMANDYIVNWTLKHEELGEMPEMGLYNPKYTDDMSSEELYEILKKEQVTIRMTLDEHLEPNSRGDEDEDGEGNEKDGQGKKKPGNGGGGQEIEVTIQGRDGPPKLTEEDLQKIRNELRAAVIHTAQSLVAAKGAGAVPAGVLRMIDELVTPKMDWRSLLDAHIRSSVKDDYTYTRISRRSWGTGLILPGQDYMNTIDISVAIDASGSMTAEMLRDIMSEIKGIMLTFRDFRLRVWSFDTQVYKDSYVEYTPENGDDIDKYPLHGGGGTMFECNWEFMKAEGIEPHRLVFFTDGYPCGSWGDEHYCPTLFVIHGNRTIKAPFGLTAYYDDHLEHKKAA